MHARLPSPLTSKVAIAMGSLPSPPLAPPSTGNPADDSLIYASFCGRGTPNWLESYNPVDNTWNNVGCIPNIPSNHFLKGFALVALDDSVYVIGGRLCTKERSEATDNNPSEMEIDVTVRSEVLRYNVTTGEWSTCAPLLTPRFDFACAACDGRIYVAGGRSVLSRGRGTAATESYDPAIGRWDALPNMSTLRYKCVGVNWQGRFYAIGGFAIREASDGRTVPSVVERSSAEVFDPKRREWDLITNMWQLDVPPNQIVTVGGRRLFSSGDCLNTWKGHIEAYDGKLNIWNIVERSHHSDLSSLLAGSSGGGDGMAMRRSYLTMAPIGARLYFLAGYRLPGDEFQSVSVVHVFDTLATTNEEAWRTSEAVVEGEKELCAHCCAVSV